MRHGWELLCRALILLFCKSAFGVVCDAYQVSCILSSDQDVCKPVYGSIARRKNTCPRDVCAKRTFVINLSENMCLKEIKSKRSVFSRSALFLYGASQYHVISQQYYWPPRHYGHHNIIGHNALWGITILQYLVALLLKRWS